MWDRRPAGLEIGRLARVNTTPFQIVTGFFLSFRAKAVFNLWLFEPTIRPQAANRQSKISHAKKN